MPTFHEPLRRTHVAYKTILEQNKLSPCNPSRQLTRQPPDLSKMSRSSSAVLPHNLSNCRVERTAALQVLNNECLAAFTIPLFATRASKSSFGDLPKAITSARAARLRSC